MISLLLVKVGYYCKLIQHVSLYNKLTIQYNKDVPRPTVTKDISLSVVIAIYSLVLTEIAETKEA